MELQLTDIKDRIINCHNGIHGSMKQALNYALEAGKLLTDIKNELEHGEFLPWAEKNLPFSRQTSDRYVKLYRYKSKMPTVSNLQEAYKQIETIEKQERESEQRKAITRVIHYRKTGEKAKDWRRGTDDKLLQEEIDRDRRVKEAQERMEAVRVKREKDREEREHRYSENGNNTDFFKQAASIMIEHHEKRQTFKEKIKLSQSGRDDAFVDALLDYLDELQDDNRRIEACNNIIKVVRNIAAQLHHKGATA